MSDSKTMKKIKDIMVSISIFPQVPYWFSIYKAARMIKLTMFDTKQYSDPSILLVFDEKYNIIGTVDLKTIFKEIEKATKSKIILERPVSEIMKRIEDFIASVDTIESAASVMADKDLDVLPVIENRKRVIGILRIKELFDEISNKVLAENAR